MNKKHIKPVTFHSLEDFRNRIARLWQEQKEDEVYEFEFLDAETKLQFEKLIKTFREE